MDTLILMLAVPVAVIGLHYAHLRHSGSRHNPKNFIFASLLGLVICVAGYFSGFFLEVHDVEVRNGVVTSKHKETVSCSHSYSCNCTKNGCSTCYEHFNDYDWVVETNIPYDFTIDRVNRQGTQEPPRFTQVKIGDAVSDEFSFTNYVKGAKKSLFNNKNPTPLLLAAVPEYPSTMHDYYHVNRMIGIGVGVPQEWNDNLQNLLGKLGPQYQVNAVVVLTTQSEDLDDAVDAKWAGGKKNDVIMVIHVDDATNLNVKSAHVTSWVDHSIFNVELQDTLANMQTWDVDKFLNVLNAQVVKNWERKHMRDFEYLTADIEIHPAIIIITLLLCVLAHAALFMHLESRGSHVRYWRTRR